MSHEILLEANFNKVTITSGVALIFLSQIFSASALHDARCYTYDFIIIIIIIIIIVIFVNHTSSDL